jgi:hypothetical protein
MILKSLRRSTENSDRVSFYRSLLSPQLLQEVGFCFDENTIGKPIHFIAKGICEFRSMLKWDRSGKRKAQAIALTLTP